MVAKDVAMDAKERPIKVNFYPKNINDLLKAIFMKTLEMLWNYFDISIRSSTLPPHSCNFIDGCYLCSIGSTDLYN
jgi:hypothetical protein